MCLPTVERRYEKYIIKDAKAAEAGERAGGPDPFMDEYAFIMQQADELTVVRSARAVLAEATRERPYPSAAFVTVKKMDQTQQMVVSMFVCAQSAESPDKCRGAQSGAQSGSQCRDQASGHASLVFRSVPRSYCG